MNVRRWMFAVCALAAVSSISCGASSPPADPAGNGLIDFRIIPAASSDCQRYKKSVRESIGAAVVGAVLPKVIDAGLTSLSAALRKASGEDSKTAVTEAILPTMAYDYDVTLKLRTWSKELVCLGATSKDKTFDAAFVLVPSTDASAISARLAMLNYKSQLKAGRDVVGMTMAIIFKGVDGAELANGLIGGPFVPSQKPYEAAGDQAPLITTPWMPLPAAGEATKAILSTYDDQCATRKEAVRQFVDAEQAKAKANKTPLNPAIKLTIDPAGGVCGGLKMLPGALGTAWSIKHEAQLGLLENSIKKQVPVTLQLVVTETRDVNKFLLKVSEIISGSKEELKTALVANIDPTKKAEAAKTDDGLEADYGIALAQFEEKVRLYRVAVTAANKAQADLETANKSGNADAIATASQAADQALAARASAFEAALTSRKAARQAAYAAGISIAPGSTLATFPN